MATELAVACQKPNIGYSLSVYVQNVDRVGAAMCDKQEIVCFLFFLLKMNRKAFLDTIFPEALSLFHYGPLFQSRG